MIFHSASDLDSTDGTSDTGSESASGRGNNEKKVDAGITTLINIFTKSDGPVLDLKSGQPVAPPEHEPLPGALSHQQTVPHLGRMLDVDGSPFSVIPLSERSESYESGGKHLPRPDIQKDVGQEVLLVPVSALVNDVLLRASKEEALEELLSRVLELQTPSPVALQMEQIGYLSSSQPVSQMAIGQLTAQTGQLIGQHIAQQIGQPFGQQVTQQVVTQQAGQQITQYPPQPTYQRVAQPVGLQMMPANSQLAWQPMVQPALQQTGQVVGQQVVQPVFQQATQPVIQPMLQQMHPIMSLPVGQVGNTVVEQTAQRMYQHDMALGSRDNALTGQEYCIGEFVQTVSEEVLYPTSSPLMQQPGPLQQEHQQISHPPGSFVPQKINIYTGKNVQPASQQMGYVIGQQAYHIVPGFTQSVYQGPSAQAKKRKPKKKKREDENKKTVDMQTLLAKEPLQALTTPSTQKTDYVREDVITVKIVDTVQNSRCCECNEFCEAGSSLLDVGISGGPEAVLPLSHRARCPRGDSWGDKGLEDTKFSDYSTPLGIGKLRESRGQTRQNEEESCCQKCPCTLEDRQARNNLSVCRLSIEAVDFLRKEQGTASSTPISYHSQRQNQQSSQQSSYQSRRQKGSSSSPTSSGQAGRASGRPKLRELDKHITSVPRKVGTTKPSSHQFRDQTTSGQDGQNGGPADAARKKLPLPCIPRRKSVQRASPSSCKSVSGRPVTDISATSGQMVGAHLWDYSVQTRRPPQLPMRDNFTQTTEHPVLSCCAQGRSPAEKLQHSRRTMPPFLQPVLERLDESHSDHHSEDSDPVQDDVAVSGKPRQPVHSPGHLTDDELDGTSRTGEQPVQPVVNHQENKASCSEPRQLSHASDAPLAGEKFEEMRIHEVQDPDKAIPYGHQAGLERKSEHVIDAKPGPGAPSLEQHHPSSCRTSEKQELSDYDEEGANVSVWVILVLFIALVVAIFVVFIVLPMGKDEGNTSAEPYAEPASGEGKTKARTTANIIHEKRILTHALLEPTTRMSPFTDTEDPEWPEWKRDLRVWNL